MTLTASFAFGQEKASEAPKLETYQAKALANALQAPNSGTGTKLDLDTKLKFLDLQNLKGPPIVLLEGDMLAGTCAVPLITLRADPKIDPRLGHSMSTESKAVDKLSTRPAMPVCRN